MSRTLRFGADVGGTFTDVIALDDAGGVRTLKVPSTPPDFEQAVLRAIETLQGTLLSERVESVAVCFLHAYAFPHHEEIVGEFLRRELPGLQVSLSSEVLRERKEYERTSTTVVNAYVRPVMRRYLNALREGL